MNKFARKLVKILPDSIALQLLVNVSNRLRPLAIGGREKEAMLDAKSIRFGAQNANQAWAWGDGPVIVLVHGWGGRAAQFGPLAQQLAALGYRCVAPDVTGHGDARSRKTRWSWFQRDLIDLVAALDTPVHAFVGHSAGGLNMMAARSRGKIAASKYICICAPSYPFPPLRAVKAALAPSEKIMSRYKTYLVGEFSIPWSALKDGASFKGAGEDLLLIYEERDRLIAHTEGDRIHAMNPGSKLLKTNAYGHQKILAAPELAEKINGFLSPEPSE